MSYVSYKSIVKRYLVSLEQEYSDAVSGKQHTEELSFRPPLDTFFRELASEISQNPNVVVVLEPKNQAQMGRPDWRMHDRDTLGVYGYIEAKGLSLGTFDIDSHMDQFNRYLSLGHKLIITDGIDFIHAFEEGAKPEVISLIDKNLMSRTDWSKLDINPLFEHLMRSFFSEPSPQYCDEESLVELVALRTRILSDEILKFSVIPLEEAMSNTEKNAILLLNGLRDLVYTHNDQNMHDDRIFADFTAQVIMFTLLYAHRVECTDIDSAPVKEGKIREFISISVEDNQVLRPFLTIIQYIKKVDKDNSFIQAWTNECISFLSFVHISDQQRSYPDYHKLFELFLSKFDMNSRFDYGAFYTPPELADYIVRLTERIVNQTFDGNSIYAKGNTIIDPCCGTGSFLERVRRNDASQKGYNLCGIEILPAPYMLANYRMAIIDKELGEKPRQRDLLLANTLSNYLFEGPINTDTVEGYELNRALEISSRPITLVIGNPPSSDSSKINIGEEFSRILDLMNDFRPPIKDRRGRQNIQKQVNNPYLQFLRWACEKLSSSQNHSVLSFIVPSSFLEADSYKYARKYLLDNFSELWVISVDADARAGIRSDSLFKTQQGRAIVIATHHFDKRPAINSYRYYDISRISKSEKISYFKQKVENNTDNFSVHSIDESNFGLVPSTPFNQELYYSYWPISANESESAIFSQYCSGIKLSPTSIFTHKKAPMLKRRSKEIMQRGLSAAEEWLGNQDKPPKKVETLFFADELKNHGNSQAIDALLDLYIKDYTFRPFLPMKAFLWQDLLKKYAKVGGGGTRRRPEISAAYNAEGTVGLALSHSPKDQKDTLKQFVSFCWYHPDNDLCRRGNSYIYLNQYPGKGSDGVKVSNNINDKLCAVLSKVLGVSTDDVATEVVFYTFAVLCSQVYLDTFEGALFTVNRSDMRPRIPIVCEPSVFRNLSSLGNKLANLEKRDYTPRNIMNFDVNAILAQLPDNYKLKTIDFDEEHELIILTDGLTTIEIPCPIDVQRINIGGYDVLKHVWMKFNSYNYSHCILSSDDVIELLTLINKLLEHISLVGKVDLIMHNIVSGNYKILKPI